MKRTCPSKDRLREFLEGSVDDTEAGQISDHIEDCSSCDLLISRLESDQDRVVKELLDGLRIAALLEEPELFQLRQTVTTPDSDSADAIDQEGNIQRGKRLRDYRLVKKIGEGGMGTIYQAVHVHLGKSVAIKILPTDKLRSKHSVERFRQEMRAVGRVNHPNVVSASDAGAVDGQHYLVMELVEGADLARIIQHCGPLRIADACEIVRQAAIGLQHAHDIGLVHRDVKPSNLMLAIDGTVKLLDLGLAGLNCTDFESTANVIVADRLTSVGQILGTLDFMAPEQITSSTQVDGRADVYALGATLFQLLTKQTPCGDRTADTPERIDAVLNEPPLEIAKLRSDVPEGLCVLIETMLAKEPENRPQLASDVACELSRFARDANLVALADACKTSLDIPSADVDITDDVSLVVSCASSHRDIVQSPRPVRRSRRWRVLGLATAILFFAALAVPFVFTFQTKFGTVEVDLPHGAEATNVRIALEKGGETVRVMEPSGRWTIKVEAGRYDTKLLSGDEQFELVSGVLTVKSGEKSIVRIRRLTADPKRQPDIEELFRIGQYRQAAELAEAEAERNPDERPNHGRAAIMWLYISLQDPNDSDARAKYNFHRNWLADRWARTGEAPRTIPRICCMRDDPPGDLDRMLAAIAQESEQYPEEAWQYAHSRMIVLYRLRRYEESFGTFAECRQLAPRDPMRAAVDHLWAANILNRLGQTAEASHNRQKGLQLLGEASPRDNKPLSSKLFDFVETHAALEEASNLQWNTAQAMTRFLPYSLCTADFQLEKWRSSSDEITSAAFSRDGRNAVFGLGWRPGTWEWWKLDLSDSQSVVVSDDAIVHWQGGQPVRSVAFHPTEPIAALGRWYGAVDVVQLADNKILATRITSIGKLRKANGLRFTADGDHLLIGYQSNRLVDWNWPQQEDAAQQTFPSPIWRVFASEGGEVLVGTQIWNRISGKTRNLDVTGAAAWLSPDAKTAVFRNKNRVKIYDVIQDEVVLAAEFPSDVTRLVPFLERKRIITGHANGELRMLDIFSGRSVLLGRLHNNHTVDHLQVDDSQRNLLTTTGKRRDRGRKNDHQIAVWSLSQDLLTRPLDELQSSADEVERRRRDIHQQIVDESEISRDGKG